jgi:hypothetical protein
MKNGECYRLAAQLVMDNREYKLVHAEVTGEGPIKGIRYGHAFTTFTDESSSEWVFDPSGENETPVKVPKALYFKLGNINPDEIIEYPYEEVLENILKHETWGPWAEEALNWYHG